MSRGMSPHLRLLRALLLLVSALTLTGLHVPHERTPRGWRAARLVPLALSALSVVGNIGDIVSSIGNAFMLMFSLSMNVNNVQGYAMMLFLMYHRRRVHQFLQRIWELDQMTVGCQRKGEYRGVSILTILLAVIPFFCLFIWMVGFFSTSGLAPPNYIINWYIPPQLNNRNWFGIITVVQVLSGLISNTCQMSFDVLLVGFAGAVALLQERLATYCQKYLTLSSDADLVSGVSGRFNDEDATHLTTLYSSVRDLADDLTSFCSLPTLLLHTTVAAGMLFGSYVSILMVSTKSGSSTAKVIGFASYTLSMVLRLVLVSWAGSWLIERGEQLQQTLARLRWPASASPAARFQLQQLMEQTRQPPAFHGWGLFTVQKTNMVALFSFVLTYFVILLQMQVR
ncbi:hypothetical protein FJT64_002907 [Amphibalanus amphitrite]|uniref:Odorant receptor n=1 Tax=Amphibalanus amphitrite TaxID=1232801 RepID=A0A6A4W735_AMPAM|nr:hypothetical protein FJT64_002907 [Amphibalanus amphitrite]